MGDIAANIRAITADMKAYAATYNRLNNGKPNAALMAVSKFHNIDSIEQAINAGQTLFGENRVQEAEQKFSIIKQQHPHIKLHLIGPLQTNKVNKAITLFDVIQTVDREDLALSLAKKMPKCSLPELMIQINSGDEPQKAGITPDDAKAFIEYCIADLCLPVIGLMAIPPKEGHAAPHFAYIKKMCHMFGLQECSIGMSADYHEAIRQGSTMIRLGTAIFGER